MTADIKPCPVEIVRDWFDERQYGKRIQKHTAQELLDRLETMRDVAIRNLSDLSSTLELALTYRNEQMDARDALLKQMAEALQYMLDESDHKECDFPDICPNTQAKEALAAYEELVGK